MKLTYFGDTDSLVIDTGADWNRAVGEIRALPFGEDLVVTADGAGTLYQLEVMGRARELLDLEGLTVEVVEPDGLTAASHSAPLLTRPETREEALYRGPGTTTAAEARIHEHELQRRREAGEERP